MRKSLFFAAFACVALASCVTDDVSENNQEVKSPQKITFNAPVVSGITRAAQPGENPDGGSGVYNTNEKFTVFAVWHNENFAGWKTNTSLYINEVEMVYDNSIDDASLGSGAWAPTGNQYYWPKNGYLTFAAYSPSAAEEDSEIEYDNNGLQIKDFQVKSDAKDQYDLMFSKKTMNKNGSYSEGNGTYDGVDIIFQHALSNIQFTVNKKEVYAGTTIKLYSIKIWGVNSKGTFNQNITDEVNDVYTPVWTVQSNLITKANAYVAYKNDSGLEITENGTGKHTLNGTTGQNDLILLPQVLPADAIIEVTYSLTSGAGNEITQVSETKINTLTPEWIWNTRFIYNITIGLDKIYFAPAVESWTNAGEGSIEI